MSLSKVDSTIKKETANITIVAVILSALLQAVYLIIGKWDLSVLLGNLLGSCVGVLNFFLMGIGLQKSLDKDEKGARATVSFSHTMRFLLMAGVILLSVFLDCFKLLPTVLGLFFPSIGVYIRTFVVSKKKEELSE